MICLLFLPVELIEEVAYILHIIFKACNLHSAKLIAELKI